MRSREARSVPPGTVQAHGIRRWWLNRSLRAKGLIVVAVPLIALMGLTSANLLLQQNESNERSISTNARNLQEAAYDVLADTVNGETGIRGYAATRDPIFLAPYTLMLTRIGAERTSLRQAAVVEGDGRQQRTVDATTGQVLADLAQLRSAISDGSSAGNLLPALLSAKTTMDRLRGQVADLAAAPTAVVAVTFYDGRCPQRFAFGPDPRQREGVRGEEERVAGRGVAADTRFPVDRAGEHLGGRVGQVTGIGADVSFIALTVLEQQVRRDDAHQGDQRHRDHDQALRPQGQVEPPPPEPVRLARARRR